MIVTTAFSKDDSAIVAAACKRESTPRVRSGKVHAIDWPRRPQPPEKGGMEMASDLLTPLMRGMFFPALGLILLDGLVRDRPLHGAGPSPRAQDEVKQRVDLIELNHYYDSQGKHQFDQVIFYEWSPDYRRFHVIAWSLVEGDLKRMPRQMPGSDLTCVTWFDRDAKVHREVQSKLYRETWTQSDPERTNKQWFEEKDRLCLARLTERATR